ncbi:MAG TPA: hypothetical protein VFL98_03510 [Candidatus Paceibacterota bacterium]|nr:hypothetical protein [Candidatus Paceibacterota bacterium]
MDSYKYGSKWRRWDLHLHTPETLKEDQYTGTTPEEKWENFCNDINSTDAEVSVVGVTDYLLIDNYRKFHSFIDSGKITKKFDLVIPNIELRLTPVTGSGTALNLHLLIDPAFVDQLESRIYSKLKIKSGTTEYTALRADLIRLGKTIDAAASDDVAYKKGAEQFVIDFDTLKGVFDNDPDLRNHCLIVVANSSHDGATGVTHHASFFTATGSSLDTKRQAIYKFVDAIFSANPSDRTYFLGKSSSDTRDIVIDKCGSLKPCVHGCDAHTNAKIFKPDQNRYCWIKANPTFEGLRQILFEPEERICVQELQPDEKELYRVIDKVKLTDANFTAEPLELNPNLNVIIGSRSSGKTTLLNSIAKAVDVSEYELRHKDSPPIKEPPSANVFWLDGAESGAAETQKGITYIPQNYINSLAEATEENSPILEIAENALFDSTGGIAQERKDLNLKIEQLNRTIGNDVYQLFVTRKQIAEQKEKIKKIGDKKGIEEQIKKVEAEIAKLQKDLTKAEAATLKKLREEYADNKKQIETITADVETLTEETADVERGASFFEERSLSLKSEELSRELGEFTGKLQDEYLQKYVAFVNRKKEELAKEKKKLEEDNKKILDNNKVLIDKAKQNTAADQKVKEKEAQDKKLAEISSAEKALKTSEDALLATLTKIVLAHKERSNARHAFVAKATGDLEGIEYRAVVGIDTVKLDKFMTDFVNFHNSTGARTQLNAIPGYKTGEDTDVSTLIKNDNIKTTAELILSDTLKLKAGIDLQRAIEGLFGDFEFINYSLKYEGDNYPEMTPGKKSLVVLKLLVESSEDKYPILIDQPEDDLDSRSISGEIVDFLRSKKKERQIILVTHNANIAIKADAEEIIVANRHSTQHPNKNAVMFDYTTGAIETSFVNPSAAFSLDKMGMREHACELLEGGEEAFENRKNKYNLK